MITEKLQKEAIAHIAKHDVVLEKIIKKVPPPVWNSQQNYFIALVESIVSQQLSAKAADTIWARFIKLSDDPDLTARSILGVEDRKIRDAGISWSKISYIKNLAQRVVESPNMFEYFDTMSNEEIVEELVKVKGIGQWTVEMFLIFTMGRPDVFSYGDLGIRNAIKKLYGFSETPTKEEAEQIAEKWKPYRSIACRYLWKSLGV